MVTICLHDALGRRAACTRNNGRWSGLLDSSRTNPRLGELLLGTEGLALLRLAFTADDAARSARVSEIRALLQAMDDAELAAPLAAPEYDVDAGYDLWSKTYDAPLRLFFIEQPAMQALFATLPAGAVLDAACGTGRHGVELAQRGHRVIGVDRSAAMLARARAKLPQADFREGDLMALPVDSGSVDAAVCALALVHVADLDGAVAELARAVRPGGRVIVSDVHPFLVLLGWQAQFRTADGGTGFMRLHPHPLSAYSRAFAAAGLRIRSLDEPALTPQSAITVAAERLPDANQAAWVGLPGVVVWDLEKP
jgi:ubiquinone/menaquinone biosynthesis C-methylase UbiE